MEDKRLCYISNTVTADNRSAKSSEIALKPSPWIMVWLHFNIPFEIHMVPKYLIVM